MTKYYAYFIYKNEEYVIQLKVNESLKWNAGFYCFIDNQRYIYSLDEIVCKHAFGKSTLYKIEELSFIHMITRKDFIEQQIFHGVKQWKPKQKDIRCYNMFIRDVY